MLRLLDILLSGLALLVLGPPLLLVALVLRVTGEGEVLFRQSRIGRGGQRFELLKFATMLKNSPSIGTGEVTMRDDPRVLPVGRVLRKTKLNELPQLINVLRGEMSVIGPRPQTQRCFDAFPQRSQQQILQVRPGLSGVGSILFRDEAELTAAAEEPTRFYDEVLMPYKGQVEEWFVAHSGLRVYVLCILLTLWVIAFPRSGLVWRVFPDLPAPPEALRSAMNHPA